MNLSSNMEVLSRVLSHIDENIQILDSSQALSHPDFATICKI